MKRRTLTIAAVVGVLVALAASGTALALSAPGTNDGVATDSSASCSGSGAKLTVQGTGMATATPNELTVSVGIEETQPSAQASLTADNTKAAAVAAALEQGGVLQKDVQTTNFTIQPDYNLKGQITGYQVTNTLTANLRNFSSAGSVIDAVAAAAGNSVQINSLSFSVSDPRALEDQARDQAVHQAVSHAKAMARAAGERLGPVCSLSDTTPTVYPYNQGNFAALPSGAASASVPLSPGSQQESAQVSVVYALETASAKV